MKQIISSIILVLLFSLKANAAVYHVSTSGNDTYDGSSWLTAFATVQQAMNVATIGDEVWIAAGTYIPTANGTGKSVCFKLKNGVSVYGGFAGNEVFLAERDMSLLHTTNETILTGDLLGDDVPTDNTLTINKSDNAYRVFSHVTADAINNTAVLNGVTITGGAATAGTTQGAGMYNQLCAPTLIEVDIRGNIASNGGGFYVTGSTTVICRPVLDHVTIANNIANTTGGGVYCLTNASPVFTNVTISGNKANGTTTAAGAGGIYIINSPLGDFSSFTNVTISNNTAGNKGGGIYIWGSSPSFKNVVINGNTAVNGGGAFITPNGTNIPHSFPLFTNVVIANNLATNKGGGLYCESNGYAIITNSTIANNTAPSGAGMYDSLNSPKVRNTIIWGNNGVSVYNAGSASPVFAHSIIQGCGGSGGWLAAYGTDSTANYDADPLFVTGSNELQSGSPAIDAGNDGLYTAVGGNLANDSCVDNTDRLSGTGIDIGAYEYQQGPLAVKLTAFNAGAVNENTAAIDWFAEEEAASYTLERSYDGMYFQSVATINAHGDHQYYVKDILPDAQSVAYYRLKMVEKDGRAVYGIIRKVSFGERKRSVSVSPVPAKDVVTIATQNSSLIGQQAVIINTSGAVTRRFVLETVTKVDIGNWAPGLYFLRLPGGEVVKLLVSGH